MSPVDEGNRTNNGMCVTGFVLGIVGFVLNDIGIFPILGVVFSAIGIGTFKLERQKHRWMGIVGLILGMLGTLLYLRHYGYLGPHSGNF